MAQYGLTLQGFVAKQQQTIISEIRLQLQQAFGQNINLLDESVFGQLVGIFSEREALIWQLAEAVYDSQYPNGAEGTSVDNILALNNLKRLPASPTITSPEENDVPGLVCYGVPGTIIPAGSLISVIGQVASQFSIDEQITIAVSVDAIQSWFFSNVPDEGSFTARIVDALGNTVTSQLISWQATPATGRVHFVSTPATGSFKLSLTRNGATLTTGAIAYTGNATTVQAAIQALAGYSAVTVSGTFGADFIINWGSISQPIMGIVDNTLGTVASVVDSVQAAVNNINDSAPETNKYPYSDVVVTGSFTTGFTLSFGAGTPTTGNLTSGDQPQALFTFPSNSLQMGDTVTNIRSVSTVVGTPAQGTGSATCTTNGPTFAPADTLTVIDTPVTGWTSVTNPLDCLTGSDIEDDTQAISRRDELLASNANGPIQSIVEKVSQVPFVTASLGFENLTLAALQVIAFSGVPTSGSFSLLVNGVETALIDWDDDLTEVQDAINDIAGYEDVIVTGTFDYGFTIDFNGADGGQPQSLITVVENTLDDGDPVDVEITFGRPGKSFEIVVQGGNEDEIAEAIFDAKPAGIESYGTESVSVLDQYENPHLIFFSRPTVIPIYVSITMVTDLLVNGVSNPNAKFNPDSVPTIQQELITIGDEVEIGGIIIGFGTDGLIGAFNNVPGIVSYTLFFGTSENPTENENIQLQAAQLAQFETFNIQVSYT